MENTLILISFFCGLIAMIGELVIPIFLGKKYSGYSQLKDAVSELGSPQSPVSKYFSSWLIILGLLFFLFSIGQGLLFSSYSWCHILYLLGLIIFGIAGILAGIFPEDSKKTEETISGKIHGISSGIGFLFLIFNPIWAISIKEFSNSTGLYIFFFTASLLSFIFFASSKNKKGIWGLSGLWQRLNLVILYSHLILNYLISM